jgi:hypothetical protein
MDSSSYNSGFVKWIRRILRSLQFNDDSVSKWGRKCVVITLLVARIPYALISQGGRALCLREAERRNATASSLSYAEIYKYTNIIRKWSSYEEIYKYLHL